MAAHGHCHCHCHCHRTRAHVAELPPSGLSDFSYDHQRDL
jgi:hypothetical protein